MAIDTPARLAILGAGPIGLEAALYARFLGYEVVVYERGEVADTIRQRGHLRMFAPFKTCHTTLGLAAIQAQNEAYALPPADERLTYGQWRERYLLPLAATDLVSDHLRLQTTVVAVGKEELLKPDMPGHEERGDWSFRILSRDAADGERIELFDGVLDCTGNAVPNWLGHGGIPAIGETALRDEIEYGWPDISGRDRSRYAGKRVLLVGGGLTAAASAVALGELAASGPNTQVTWITRREGTAGTRGPISATQGEFAAAQAELVQRANEIATSGAVTYWPRTVVERVSRVEPADGRQFEVELSGEHAGTIVVDEIIANAGFQPDNRLFAELQIDQHSAWQAPARLMRAIDDGRTSEPQSLVCPEPNFYILGRKSFGRRPGFELSIGYDQIRQAFTIIGDRPGLNLYESATRLLRQR
jgi:thioredoxin reductase